MRKVTRGKQSSRARRRGEGEGEGKRVDEVNQIANTDRKQSEQNNC